MNRCGECGLAVTPEQSFCTNCGWRNPAGSAPGGFGPDSTRTHSPWKAGSLGANLDAAFAANSCGHCGDVHEPDTRYCPRTGNLTVTARGSPAPGNDPMSNQETRVFARPSAASPPGPAASAGAATLVVHRGSGNPHRKPLEIGQELIIGREKRAGVIAFPQDHYLTPLHARFFWRGRRLVVEDLNTLNKVFSRVREPADLREGDRIRVGNHVFRFELVHRSEEDLQELTRANEQRGVLILGTKGEEARARLIVRLDTGLRGKEYFIGPGAIVIGREKGTHNFRND